MEPKTLQSRIFKILFVKAVINSQVCVSLIVFKDQWMNIVSPLEDSFTVNTIYRVSFVDQEWCDFLSYKSLNTQWAIANNKPVTGYDLRSDKYE